MGMIQYIIKRLLAAILSMFLLVTATFFLMHAVPGSPFNPGEQKNIPPEILAQIRSKYGLDDPPFKQYVSYMGKLLQGDLGVSFKKQNYSVNELVMGGFPGIRQNRRMGHYCCFGNWPSVGNYFSVEARRLDGLVFHDTGNYRHSCSNIHHCDAAVIYFCNAIRVASRLWMGHMEAHGYPRSLLVLVPDCVHYPIDAFEHVGSITARLYPHSAGEGCRRVHGNWETCCAKCNSPRGDLPWAARSRFANRQLRH